MFGRILFIVVLIPLLELTFLYQLLIHTGFVTTFAVVLMTGVVGIQLARYQGLQAWQEIHRQLSNGKAPSESITRGVLILIAGIFLITPGVLTDTLGFLLLIPAVRTHVARWLKIWFLRKTRSTFETHVWSGFGPRSDRSDDQTETVKGQVRVVNPQASKSANEGSRHLKGE